MIIDSLKQNIRRIVTILALSVMLRNGPGLDMDREEELLLYQPY